jgi:hypothetical protein
VLSLRTVAGNLDHADVNQFHHVNLMPESLNANDVASKINHIPQLHFVGRDDKVIPKEVAKRFIKQQESTQQKTAQCVAIVEVDAEHQKGWVHNDQSFYYKLCLTSFQLRSIMSASYTMNCTAKNK